MQYQAGWRHDRGGTHDGTTRDQRDHTAAIPLAAPTRSPYTDGGNPAQLAADCRGQESAGTGKGIGSAAGTSFCPTCVARSDGAVSRLHRHSIGAFATILAILAILVLNCPGPHLGQGSVEQLHRVEHMARLQPAQVASACSALEWLPQSAGAHRVATAPGDLDHVPAHMPPAPEQLCLRGCMVQYCLL